MKLGFVLAMDRLNRMWQLGFNANSDAIFGKFGQPPELTLFLLNPKFEILISNVAAFDHDFLTLLSNEVILQTLGIGIFRDQRENQVTDTPRL